MHLKKILFLNYWKVSEQGVILFEILFFLHHAYIQYIYKLK